MENKNHLWKFLQPKFFFHEKRTEFSWLVFSRWQGTQITWTFSSESSKLCDHGLIWSAWKASFSWESHKLHFQFCFAARRIRRCGSIFGRRREFVRMIFRKRAISDWSFEIVLRRSAFSWRRSFIAFSTKTALHVHLWRAIAHNVCYTHKCKACNPNPNS